MNGPCIVTERQTTCAECARGPMALSYRIFDRSTRSLVHLCRRCWLEKRYGRGA